MHGAPTLSIKTLSIKTLSIKTLSIMTLSIKTLSIKTFSIASCAFMLNDVIQIVANDAFMLNVVKLSVLAPKNERKQLKISQVRCLPCSQI